MKRIALGLLVFTFTLSLNLTFAQDNRHKSPDGIKTDVTKSDVIKTDVTAKAEVTKGTGKPVNTVCIVSGEDLDGKVLADYKGKTYSFCCKTCLKKFTKDPEKYVAKFEKSLKTKS